MLKIDSEKLKSLIKSFYDLTHLKISLYDENYVEIINYPSNKGKFFPENLGLCSYVTSTNAVEVCRESNNCAFDKCKQTGEPVIYKCPFQLYDSVSPLIHNDTVIGYFMIGQVRDESDDFNEMIPILQKYNLDPDIAKELYYSQTVMNKNLFRQAMNILNAISSYLYLLKIISLTPADIGAKIDQFIDENLHTDISVEKLCKYLHYSRTNLYKIFEELFDKSIAQYVRDKRIDKAKILLATSDESITAIAMKVGIPDYNYFTKVFTKCMQISPSKYRKKKKAEFLKKQIHR